MREEEGRIGDYMVWLSNKKNHFQLCCTLLSGGLEKCKFYLIREIYMVINNM